MCRGCKIRERIIARTNTRLAEAFAKLEAAHDATRALLIDTSGPTRLSEKPRTFSDKPAAVSPTPPHATHKRAGARGQQLTLAL